MCFWLVPTPDRCWSPFFRMINEVDVCVCVHAVVHGCTAECRRREYGQSFKVTRRDGEQKIIKIPHNRAAATNHGFVYCVQQANNGDNDNASNADNE